MGLHPPIPTTIYEEFKLSYLPDLIELKKSGSEKETLTAIDVELHQQEIHRLSGVLESASQSSHLPESPTAKPALNDLLVRLRVL